MHAPTGKSRDARRKRRTDSAIVREDHLLTLYAGGLSWAEMVSAMRIEYGGTFAESTLRRMVYRGLERRSAEVPKEVAVARQMVMDRLERLFGPHMQLALGVSTGVPDVRSGELALKVLNTMAEVLGVKKAPPTSPDVGNIAVNIVIPDNLEKARRIILAGLQQEADKHQIVEGHLAAVGTGLDELTAEADRTDTMAPPPGVVIEEREAA